MATRCRIPRENVRTKESRRSNKPTSRNIASTRFAGSCDSLQPREKQQIFLGGQFVVHHGRMRDEPCVLRGNVLAALSGRKTQLAR